MDLDWWRRWGALCDVSTLAHAETGWGANFMIAVITGQIVAALLLDGFVRVELSAR